MTTEVLNRSDRLVELEEQIYKGFAAFYEAGQALQEIQEEKLYKEAGHKTFDGYCLERWGIKRSRVYQLIDASKVYQNLSTMVDILPTSERQVRPLVPLEPTDQTILWQKTVETAEGQPTGKQVEQVCQDFRPAPKPGKMPPKQKTSISPGPNLSGDFDPGPPDDFDPFNYADDLKSIRTTLEEAGYFVASPEELEGEKCPTCGRSYH